MKSSLLPPTAQVSLGGSLVCVKRLTTAQTLHLLPQLLKLVDCATSATEGMTIADLVSKNLAEVVEIAAVSTDRTPEQIAKLKAQQFADLVEALLVANKDFMYRAVIVEAMGGGEPAEAEEQEPMTVEKAVAFIERVVYDLAAAGVSQEAESLQKPLAQNLALLDAVSRKSARDKLANLDALQSAIAAAFSEDAWSVSTILTARRQLSWPVESGE